MKLSDGDMKKQVAKLVREMDARQFTPTPVLNEHQWKVHYLLKRSLQNDHFEVLVGVCLSAFVNPSGHSRYVDVLENSALFAVVTEPPRCSVVLLILDRNAQVIETILEEQGIKSIRYAPLIGAEEFSAQVTSLIPTLDTVNKAGTTPINFSELSVRKLIVRDSLLDLDRHKDLQLIAKDDDDLLWSSSNTILHEVALHRLAPKFPLKFDALELRMIRQSSLDLVVHGREGQGNLPLVAVEYDGPEHSKPKQLANDQAKDRILDKFGIPLIRIGLFELDFSNAGLDKRQEQRRYAQLLSSIIHHVMCRVQSSFIDQLEESDARREFHSRENELSKSMFGRHYLDLTKTQQEEIYMSMAITQLDWDYDLTTKMQVYYEQRDLEDTKQSQLWPEDLVSYSKAPVFFTEDDGVRWAQATLTLGSKSIHIKTPRVRIALSHRFEEDDLMRGRIDVCLIENVADTIREYIRMNTPARPLD